MRSRPLLIFDLDNTLWNRNRAFVVLLQRLVTERTPHLSLAQRKELVRALYALDDRGRSDRSVFCAAALRLCPALAESPEELSAAHDGILEFVRPARFAWGVLRSIRGDYSLAILTNGSNKRQSEKLRRTGTEGLVDATFVSESIGFQKPDPRAFDLVVRHFNAERELCVMIGDDPLRDIKGARAAGLRTIHLGSDPGVNTDAQTPALRDIPSLVSTLLNHGPIAAVKPGGAT